MFPQGKFEFVSSQFNAWLHWRAGKDWATLRQRCSSPVQIDLVIVLLDGSKEIIDLF